MIYRLYNIPIISGMFHPKLTLVILCLAGIGYILISIIFKAKLIVRFTYAICGGCLVSFGLFFNEATISSYISVAALILPFVIHRIFDRDLSL